MTVTYVVLVSVGLALALFLLGRKLKASETMHERNTHVHRDWAEWHRRNDPSEGSNLSPSQVKRLREFRGNRES